MGTVLAIALSAIAGGTAGVIADRAVERRRNEVVAADDLERIAAVRGGEQADEDWLRGIRWAAVRGDLPEDTRSAAAAAGLELPEPRAKRERSRTLEIVAPAALACLGSAMWTGGCVAAGAIGMTLAGGAALAAAGSAALAATACADARHHEVPRLALVAGTAALLGARALCGGTSWPELALVAACGLLTAAGSAVAHHAGAHVGTGDAWLHGCCVALALVCQGPAVATMAATCCYAASAALDPDGPEHVAVGPIAIAAVLAAGTSL